MYRKVWLSALAKAALIATVLAPVTPRTVQAQDCGTNCGTCGTGKKEGYSYHAQGQYNMDCQDAITGCVACAGGDQLVKDAAQAPGALLSTLRSVPLESLRQMAPTLRDRLMVHPTRNIVAVRGSACQSKSVVALAFLSRERMEILSHSGLPGLEDFLNQAVSQAK